MKSRIREEMKLRRESMDPEERRARSRKIAAKLMETDEYLGAKTIMVYISFDSEAETWELIEDMLRGRKRVAVPVADAGGGTLKPCVIKDLDPSQMEKNRFGILEPKRKKEIPLPEIQLVVVPGIAFDSGGNRLGWGRGYYDKFLHTLPEKIPVVGLGFDFQILEGGNRLPCENYDRRVDAVVTESRVVRCAGKPQKTA